MAQAERGSLLQALPHIQKVQLLHPAADWANGDMLVMNGNEIRGAYKPPHALLEEGLVLSTGERLEGGFGSLLWQLLGATSVAKPRDTKSS